MEYLRGCKIDQFEVASDFQEACKRCFAGDQDEHIVSIPAFANGFFACELYLKILTNNSIRRHELHKLYIGLSDNQKLILENRYNEIQQGNTSFDEFLQKVSSGFEFWRYIYENPNKSFEEEYPFLYSEKFLIAYLHLLKQMACEYVSSQNQK